MPVSEQLIIELKGEFDKYVKDIQNAGKITDSTQKKIETSFNKITQAMKKANTSAGDATKGLGGFGKGAGQAGIQIQQFVGQLQGGQSFMLAFGQQAADLGIVLGAPLLGAIAGITAAVAGMAVSFFSAGTDTNELIEKLRELKKEGTATAAQLELIAREDERANREKRKRIIEIDNEIKSTQGLITQYKSLEEDIGTLSDAELLRVQKIPELTEKLQDLRAEQDLLNQELNKGNQASKEALDLEQKRSEELERKQSGRNVRDFATGIGESDEIAAQAQRQQEAIALQIQQYEKERELLELYSFR